MEEVTKIGDTFIVQIPVEMSPRKLLIDETTRLQGLKNYSQLA
jgi:hypothetical protein